MVLAHSHAHHGEMRRRIAGCRVRLRQSRTARQAGDRAPEAEASESIAAALAPGGEGKTLTFDATPGAEEEAER